MHPQEKTLYKIWGKSEVVLPTAEELAEVFTVYKMVTELLDETEKREIEDGQEVEPWREGYDWLDVPAYEKLAQDGKITREQVAEVFVDLDFMFDYLNNDTHGDRYGTEGWQANFGWNYSS